jgi:hypothetical protein
MFGGPTDARTQMIAIADIDKVARCGSSERFAMSAHS